MAAAKLEELKKVDVRTVDVSTLEDIGKIRIDRTLPKEERLLAFAREVKNPFCFICNGMVVKTSYSDTGESLENVLAKLCVEMAEV
ncbi:hypothetical protein D3Z60_16630 [Lachnospiraceae bacterium]|jgi:hypothetical protein|nr:hypothetical protein [Lachnospiraceae bacterium]